MAGVGLVARVHPKVPREDASIREGLAACVAGVGLVARVHPKVRRKGVGRREGLATCVAGVGLVARVHPKVRRESVGRRKGLAACCALMEDCLVRAQSCSSRECLHPVMEPALGSTGRAS